ncbi:MAG: maleylpyruvate isomerase N-terminal domain-containing protein [Actinomycetota bacterium]
MIDYVAAVATESDRFTRAMTRGRAEAPTSTIPACPDWELDDLLWHLTEVQGFWAEVVGERLPDLSTFERAVRPESAGLAAGFDEASRRLVAVLGDADPDDACWSWHPAGQSVGWVRRRQAHEALIHRVDAEQAVITALGGELSPIDAELAADGVDELLRMMLDVRPVPEWGTWHPTGPLVRLEAVIEGDDGTAGGQTASWDVRLGRLTGTEPVDDGGGIERDLDAIAVLDGSPPAAPDAVVRAPAVELDLWLWRRLPLEATEATVDGDRSAVDLLVELATLD